MKDGYSDKYIDLIKEVKLAKKVFIYGNFVDEYVQVKKGDFLEILAGGHNSGYGMEIETGWQWDKNDGSIFIN